jgi:hypothetical protein
MRQTIKFNSLAFNRSAKTKILIDMIPKPSKIRIPWLGRKHKLDRMSNHKIVRSWYYISARVKLHILSKGSFAAQSKRITAIRVQFSKF